MHCNNWFCHIINVCDNLFIGNIESAKNTEILKKYNIEAILNISDRIYDISDKIEYMQISIDDYQNINIMQHFDKTNNFINTCVTKNKNILVHCQNGTSRSVSFILAFLLKNKKINIKEGIHIIINKRCDTKIETHPNIGFMKQLLEYEKEIIGYNSLKIDEYIKIY